MNKNKCNEITSKPNNRKEATSRASVKKTVGLKYITPEIKMGVAGLLVGLIGVALSFVFWLFPVTTESKDATKIAEVIEGNGALSNTKINNFNADYSVNKSVAANSNNAANFNTSSYNSNNTVLSNSNNRTYNSSKLVNQTLVVPNGSKPKENVQQLQAEQSIATEKLSPKKVALNSPSVYREIRETQIAGSDFQYIEILQRLNHLRQLGQTLDFSDSGQGILKANEWIETASLLVGQTDAWLSKHSVSGSDNRIYFDNMNGSTNQSKEIDRIKSVVSVKIHALETVAKVFSRDVEKLRNERKTRRIYGVQITQIGDNKRQ